jgi:tetratricopeptide (TPR) repeat protein
MSANSKLESALRLASTLENQEHWDDAETAYNKAISEANSSDRFLIGSLYINLGHVARKGGHIVRAIAYYQKAADILEGLKGESLLQRGYVLWQKTLLLLQQNHRDALTSAAESLKMHRTYPYTSKNNLADAVALDFVVRLFFGCVITETEFTGVWTEVKAAPYASVTHEVVFNFVSNYLSFIRQAHPEEYSAAREDVESWALPDFFAEIIALVESGPDSYRAVRLKHRLQQALLGIPEQNAQ